jgi:hypothetical protein
MKSTEQPQSDSFPLELLSRPEAERLNYFKSYRIKHPNLMKADAALWRAINARVSNSIIFVFGPSGVGKSTLCTRIAERLTDQASAGELVEDRLSSRPLLTEAPPPEGGGFDWKMFYRQALATIEEPFLSKLDRDPLSSVNPRIAPALAFAPGATYCEYRLSLRQALRQRRPAAFLIDEAQHIGKVASGRKLQNHMDVIKWLAGCSDAKLVLFGTYELLSLRNLSGQLSRRSVEIHFKRYRTTDKGIKSFQGVLWDFQRHLPLMIEPDLLKHWKYFYIHSIGCIGILKDWLTVTLHDALEERSRTITLDMLEHNALSVEQCESIAYESVEGEARLSNGGGASRRLLQLLGFSDAVSKRLPAVNQEAEDKKSVKSTPKLPRPVGRRAPRRDPLGRK